MKVLAFWKSGSTLERKKMRARNGEGWRVVPSEQSRDGDLAEAWRNNKQKEQKYTGERTSTKEKKDRVRGYLSESNQ